MDTFLGVSHENIGILVWLLWALIGLFGALLTSRLTMGRRSLAFDIIVGVVAGVLGGYCSAQFLGDTPMQLFLISILGAVFGAGIALWLTGTLMTHFYKG